MLPEFKRILILDDDSCHSLFCGLLVKKSFPNIKIDIVGFTDPREGLNYIETEYKKNPVKTILLLDLNMPGLTGWQVLEKLNHIPDSTLNYLTIYILSSSIDLRDIARAKENKLVKDYLEKPLSNHLEYILKTPPGIAL